MTIYVKFLKYEIVKPFVVESSTIAPCFDQPGHGTQYYLPGKVEILIEQRVK